METLQRLAWAANTVTGVTLLKHGLYDPVCVQLLKGSACSQGAELKWWRGKNAPKPYF